MIKLTRLFLSIAASALLCFIGYLALIASIHNPGPFVTLVQWVTLPVFSMVAAGHGDPGDLLPWVGIAVGGALWSGAIYTILSLVSRVARSDSH